MSAPVVVDSKVNAYGVLCAGYGCPSHLASRVYRLAGTSHYLCDACLRAHNRAIAKSRGWKVGRP